MTHRLGLMLHWVWATPQHQQHKANNITPEHQQQKANNTNPTTQHRNTNNTTSTTQHQQHNISNTTSTTQHQQHNTNITTESPQHQQHNRKPTTPTTDCDFPIKCNRSGVRVVFKLEFWTDIPTGYPAWYVRNNLIKMRQSKMWVSSFKSSFKRAKLR